jgi:hypothetical protein
MKLLSRPFLLLKNCLLDKQDEDDSLHYKKKVITFTVLSRDVTNQTLPARELLNYSRPGEFG